MRNAILVFTEVPEREITAVPGGVYHFLLEGDNLHSLRLLEKTHKGRIDVIYIEQTMHTEYCFVKMFSSSVSKNIDLFCLKKKFIQVPSIQLKRKKISLFFPLMNFLNKKRLTTDNANFSSEVFSFCHV